MKESVCKHQIDGPGIERERFRDMHRASQLSRDPIHAPCAGAIVQTDIQGNILMWNDGARVLFGHDSHEVVDKPHFSIVCPPETLQTAKHDQFFDAARRDGKWSGTILHVRSDGERFSAEVLITPHAQSAGKVDGFEITTRDASDNGISPIDPNIDAMIATDRRGVLTNVNQQMERLTGLSRGELIGSTFGSLFKESDLADEAIQQTLRDERINDVGLTAVITGGLEVDVSFSARTTRDNNGNLLGLAGIVRDVTQRTRIERALRNRVVDLERDNLAKERFLAVVSHELRTPLNAIIGFTGTLMMKLPGPLTTEQEEQLRTIRGSADHLLSLINDLLDLTRIDSGKMELHYETIGASAILNEVAAAMRPLAQTKGLAFDVGPVDPDITIRVDRRAFMQILINLASNAIKFTDAGRVLIELSRGRKNGKSSIVLCVSDTGVGMQKEDMAKLFRAFERIGEGHHRRTDGTGLGLYISQGLAKMLGGQIECESEIGKGSRFTLTLPEG